MGRVGALRRPFLGHAAPIRPPGIRSPVPSLRQFLLQALLWAVVAWLVGGLWAFKAQSAEIGEALTRYYSVRAPLVGAVAGVLWAPLLLRGTLPGRASRLAGRPRGLAVERRTRLLLRLLQGAVVGQMIGATATVMLLVVWPNDMQNTRWDAFKWGFVFWKLYWYLFIPSGTIAGMLALGVGAVGRRRMTAG